MKNIITIVALVAFSLGINAQETPAKSKAKKNTAKKEVVATAKENDSPKEKSCEMKTEGKKCCAAK